MASKKDWLKTKILKNYIDDNGNKYRLIRDGHSTILWLVKNKYEIVCTGKPNLIKINKYVNNNNLKEV